AARAGARAGHDRARVPCPRRARPRPRRPGARGRARGGRPGRPERRRGRVSAPRRIAARERDSRNRDVVWTPADGRNGPRRRELAIDASGAARTLLLETDSQGAWQRLEIGGPDGLLTLHPEGDGSIHGNVASRT